MNTTNWHFECEYEVRDYECDLQGIVNNAVYQNYLEDTRGRFLIAHNLGLMDLHNEGIDPVVQRAELDYKFSLRPGDTFLCKLQVQREGELKLLFNQQIVLKESGKLCLRAKTFVVFLVNGRIGMPEKIISTFGRYFAS
jgi:acyl-CoA thioester hydrolase